jgi:hypothetical protein
LVVLTLPPSPSIRKSGAAVGGDAIEDRLQNQPSCNWDWPDDDEVRAEL